LSAGRILGLQQSQCRLRLPIAGPEARRVEHRIAGADAVPCQAVVLAGILHGVASGSIRPEAQGESEVQPEFVAGLLDALCAWGARRCWGATSRRAT
jgi:glutamine synthetase